MSTPVVIQGTAVPNPSAKPTAPPADYSYGVEATPLDRNDRQETSCNDPLFAVLFYACVAGIFAVAALKAPDAFSDINTDTDDGTTTFDYTGYLIMSAILVVMSFGAAAVGMAVMMCIPGFLVKLSLIFVVVLSGAFAVISFLFGSLFAGIMGVIFFAIGVCYARAVWSRIPFATINLVTACTAIKKHCTITIFAYFFGILAGGWILVWALAFFGVFNEVYQCDANNVCSNPNYGMIFGLFLALFFGEQVFQVR